MEIFKLFIVIFFLGCSLAADAFTVSIVDGLNEPNMKKNKGFLIAGTFGIFQTLMPLIGYLLIRFAIDTFSFISPYIPWIAFTILLFIGLKGLYEAIFKKEEDENGGSLKIKELIVQGIATSIDALSVGFTLIDYTFNYVIISVILIGIITFIICLFGVFLGKKFGLKIGKYAEIIGSIILILIGTEILLTGLFS